MTKNMEIRPGYYGTKNGVQPHDLMDWFPTSFGIAIKHLCRCGQKPNNPREKDLAKAYTYLGFALDKPSILFNSADCLVTISELHWNFVTGTSLIYDLVLDIQSTIKDEFAKTMFLTLFVGFDRFGVKKIQIESVRKRIYNHLVELGYDPEKEAK